MKEKLNQGNHQQKAEANATEQRTKFQPSQTLQLGRPVLVLLTFKSRIPEGLWNLSPWLGLYLLHGGSERPLHQSVKVMPGQCWRPQDSLDATVMGYLSWKTGTSPRDKCVAVNKAKRRWESEEHTDIRHRDAEFGVGLDGF